MLIDSTWLEIQNPWWENPDAIGTDTHLSLIKDKPYFYKHAIVSALEFHHRDLHIIRGPRQVGKTTLLKQWVDRLLNDGVSARQILYFSCEAVVDFKELQQTLTRWLSSTKKTSFVFLDEISFVPQWQRAILALINVGLCDRACLVVTGSNARDLKESSERFPGRRGKGKDLALFPLLPSQLATLPPFSGLNRMELMRLYLQIGGFPHAIRDVVETKQVTDETYRTYQNWIIGDAARFGLAEETLKHVFFRIAETLTSRISWPDLIKNTPIKSHETGLQYSEHLEQAFICHTVHCFDESKKGPNIHKARKLYFVDPLLYHLAFGWKSGISNLWGWVQEKRSDPKSLGNLFEAACLGTAKRRESVYFWYSTKQGKEIDLVLNEGNRLFDCKWGGGESFTAMGQKVSILSPTGFSELDPRVS